MNIIVVAHPDDEALWLSAALAEADRVIFCFGDQLGGGQKSAARRRAVAALPFPDLVNLNLPESGVRKLVDWAHAAPTSCGIEIADPAGRARYEANFSALLAALRPVLAGAKNVFTHNPWGEYGHPEHVQVYRAVAALQPESGATIWFSNYASPLTEHLACAASWDLREERQPDRRRAKKLFWTYWRHGAWTWPLLHRWPRREIFFGQNPGGGANPMAGQTLLDVTKLRWARRGPAEFVLDQPRPRQNSPA